MSQGRPPGDFKRGLECSTKAEEALRGLNSSTSITVTWSDSEPANTGGAALSHTTFKK